MAVTPEEVMYIAQLARLHLTPAEVERFTPQLNRVLAHAAELAEVDVGGVAPTGGVAEWQAPLRADEPAQAALHFPPEQLSVQLESLSHFMSQLPPAQDSLQVPFD